MTTSTPSIHHDAAPSEVGWQFVSQYYLFVHKQPHLLHLFYNKASTLIRGTEGEDDTTCYGQKAIYDKFTSIGFKNTKVFIHSVDAQSSANGGILIQVIGQMSNDGDPNYHKFVQTFFLAEQPNGYFVLNDVFRFLREETVDEDDAVSEADGVIADSQPAPDPEPVAESPIPPDEPEPVTVPAAILPAPTPQVIDEAPTVVVPDPVEPSPPPSPEPQVNGIHLTDPEPTPEPPAPVEQSTPPPAPSPAPAQQPLAASPAPSPPQQVAPAPKPAAPPVPRTWANLAAQDPKRWGPAVNFDSRGTTEVPVAANSPAPPSGTQTPPSQHGPPHGRGPVGGREHPAIAAVQNLATAQVFVKGVSEAVSNTLLTQVLTSRFGPIKDLEIVRSKACAFLEFLSLDAAKKAIITSLPPGQGGEGGIRIDVGGSGEAGGGGQVRISIETKKERGDRPAPRPRGGAPPINGGERGGGGFRGRGGSERGRGRGTTVGGK